MLMIGPHEGQELELMLAGKKHLAAFSDVVPPNGIIDEQIIPEKKFKPYVDSGKIIRQSTEFKKPDGHLLRIVCFTTPHEQWRANTYIYIRKKLHFKEVEYTNSMDQLIGKLLGYSQDDIDDFLNHQLQLNCT